MTKSLLKLVLAALVLAGVIAAYIFLTARPGVVAAKKAAQPHSSQPLAPPAQTPSPDSGMLGAGDRPWVRQYDENGRLAFQFRAADYQPEGADLFSVRDVETDFFLTDGRIMRLKAVSGRVLAPSRLMERQVMEMRGRMAPPQSGNLKDVVVRLFENAQSDNPVLTAEIDNASFDNDSYRIFTDRYVNDAGQAIAADRVPVTVKGQEFDFDGYGLVVRLGDRGRDLESLEVAHGKQLTLRQTGRLLSPPTPSTPPSAAPSPAPPASTPPAAPTPPPPAAATPAAQPSSPRIYKAVLFDNVVAQRAGEFQATGQQLEMLFSPSGGSSKSKSASSSLPAAPAAKAATSDTPGPVAPTPSPTPSHTPSPSQASGSSLVSATSDQPIIVTWTGILRITPLMPAEASEQDMPSRGQYQIALSGQPVLLEQDGNKIKAATVIYRSANEEAELRGSPTAGLVLTTPDGSLLASDVIRYERATGKVTFIGNGRADIPVTSDTGQQQNLLASWNESGLAVLDQSGDKPSSNIRSLALRGLVDIEYPKLSLKAGELDLTFAKDDSAPSPGANPPIANPAVANPPGANPPGTNPRAAGVRLDTLAARKGKSDAARVDLIDGALSGVSGSTPAKSDADALVSAGASSLSADEILVKMDSLPGVIAPKEISALGNVIASDPTQKLAADRLDISAVNPPDAKGKTLVTRVFAQGNVLATASDGSQLSGHTMLMTQDRQQAATIAINGQPDAQKLATLSKEGSVLSGMQMMFDQAKNTASVIGPGSITGLAGPSLVSTNQAADPSAPKPELSKPDLSNPFRVTWQGGMTADFTANYALISTDVSIFSTDAQGAINTATSRELRIGLADSANSSSPSPQSSPSQGSAGLAGSPVDSSLAKKELKDVELRGNVRLEQKLTGPDGKLVRQTNFQSELLRYFPTGLIESTGPGRALLIDQSSKLTSAAQPGTLDPASSSGTTAMAWEREFRYDPQLGRVSMEGAVRMAYQPANPQDGQPQPAVKADTVAYRLSCEKLIADIASSPKDNAAASSAPTGSQLSSVQAEGDLVFISGTRTVYGHAMRFDPLSQIATIRGSDFNLVEVYDDTGTAQGRFQEARFNLATNQIESLRNVTGEFRPDAPANKPVRRVTPIAPVEAPQPKQKR